LRAILFEAAVMARILAAKVVSAVMLRWRVAVTAMSVVALVPVRILMVERLVVMTSRVAVPDILLSQILVIS